MNKNTIFFMENKLYRIVSSFGDLINFKQIEYHNMRAKMNAPILQAKLL